MPELLFTIGPPRSGKSTYCTQWAAEKPNRAIVCGDSIRQALGFEFRQENETLVQGIKDTMIRALLDRGHDVIVDGTHSTEFSIERIFNINTTAQPLWFPSYESYSNPILWIETEKTLYERGLKTKGEHIVPVIQRIMDNIHCLQYRYHGDHNLDELREMCTTQ